MAARSPILGYNHNIRHRGLIFHVQTEDSGVKTPHIFTHLFHGGVILSSRRLDYDADSAEDAVKGLMQAQHKAMLRDLKVGSFDEKINAYLGDVEGLEAPVRTRAARDTEVSGVSALPETPSPPEGEPSTPTFIVEPENTVPQQRSPAVEAAEEGSYQPPPLSVDHLDDSVTPIAGSSLSEALLSRTENLVDARARQRRPSRQDDVSAAFQAIRQDPTPEPYHLGDDANTTRTPMSGEGAARSDTIEAAPQSSGVPRPVRDDTPSGAYSVHRTGKMERLTPLHEQPTRPVQRQGRPGQPPSTPPPQPRPAPRQAQPPRPPPVPSVPPRPAPNQPSSPPPTPARPRAGVIVSRPAVIVGGPPRVVGGPAKPPSLPPTATARRAREEPSRPNLFGKDLISEKSLDEVILAYLSDDSSEEK